MNNAYMHFKNMYVFRRTQFTMLILSKYYKQWRMNTSSSKWNFTVNNISLVELLFIWCYFKGAHAIQHILPMPAIGTRVLSLHKNCNVFDIL